MASKKILIYFLILLLIAYPASAEDVLLNKWVLNVTVHDDGLVEEVIQIEIKNTGSLPLDGFSFVIPASSVDLIYDFDHTYTFKGIVVSQQKVPGGISLVVNFNKSIVTGDKWNGRIGFLAENWAVKEGSNYSLDIPIELPEYIISGAKAKMSSPENIEIRSQVFLPKSVEVLSVTPEPFRILFQYNHMVPTWSPDRLKIGDTINIKGSYSNVLNEIVDTDEKLRELQARVEEAKNQGLDVSEAEMHIKNVEAYNTNQALQSFWKKENSKALEYSGYANEELRNAENSLATSGKKTPEQTETETAGSEQTPGFGAVIFIFVMMMTFFAKRKK